MTVTNGSETISLFAGGIIDGDGFSSLSSDRSRVCSNHVDLDVSSFYESTSKLSHDIIIRTPTVVFFGDVSVVFESGSGGGLACSTGDGSLEFSFSLLDETDLVDLRDFFLDVVLLQFSSLSEVFFDESRDLFVSFDRPGAESPSMNMTNSSTSRSPR